MEVQADWLTALLGTTSSPEHVKAACDVLSECPEEGTDGTYKLNYYWCRY